MKTGAQTNQEHHGSSQPKNLSGEARQVDSHPALRNARGLGPAGSPVHLKGSKVTTFFLILIRTCCPKASICQSCAYSPQSATQNRSVPWSPGKGTDPCVSERSRHVPAPRPHHLHSPESELPLRRLTACRVLYLGQNTVIPSGDEEAGFREVRCSPRVPGRRRGGCRLTPFGPESPLLSRPCRAMAFPLQMSTPVTSVPLRAKGPLPLPCHQHFCKRKLSMPLHPPRVAKVPLPRLRQGPSPLPLLCLLGMPQSNHRMTAQQCLKQRGGFGPWGRQPRLVQWLKAAIKSPLSTAGGLLPHIRTMAATPPGTTFCRKKRDGQGLSPQAARLRSRREALPRSFPPTSQAELGHTASKDRSLARRNEMSTNRLRSIMPPSQGRSGHCLA